MARNDDILRPRLQKVYKIGCTHCSGVTATLGSRAVALAIPKVQDAAAAKAPLPAASSTHSSSDTGANIPTPAAQSLRAPLLVMKDQARIIARYLGSYRSDLLLLAALSLLAAATGAAVPFLAGRLIDSILAPDPLSTVLGMSVPGPLLFVVPWLALRLAGDVTDRQLTTRRDRDGIC